jgi:NADH:ubiquinone oxidoreductase subunit 6 (subunit J)
MTITITLVCFYLLSIFSIISGILTIIQGKNPINSVVYLVSCFGNSALIFMLMGVDLLGFIYIIVYVGAIAILFIFVIMMMDLRITETKVSEKSLIFPFYNYPLILIIIISSLFMMVPNIEKFFFSFSSSNLDSLSNITSISTIDLTNLHLGEFLFKNSSFEKLFPCGGPLGVAEGSPLGAIFNDFTTWEIAQRSIWESLIQNSMSSIIQSVGYLLYTDFLSLLLLASLILLMVMVSVIALVKIPAAE